MFNYEKAFWDKVAGAIDEGWRISTPTGPTGAPQVPISAVDHYVYAYDTLRDWTSCAGLSKTECDRMEAHLRDAPQQVRDDVQATATTAVREAADANAVFDGEQATQALLATLAAIALSQTYQLAKQRWSPGRSQHLIYVVYRCRDGHQVGRPVAVVADGKRLLEPDHLASLIDQVIKQDTATGETSVQRMLMQHGGAILASQGGVRRAH